MAIKRVLIVEDELVAAMALEMELSALGLETIATVTSAEEAVETALSAVPDLIFMDIYLDTEATGIEAVEQIHAVRGIPVIYTTASQNPEIMRRVNNTRYVALLQKPYIAIEIVRILYSLAD